MTISESAVEGVILPPRYELRATLKKTSETLVLLVHDAATRGEKALKILLHEVTDQQQLLRFQTEFTTLAAVDHRGVIRVHEFGVLDGRYPYFTMEYFAGRRITEFFDGQNWGALYRVILQIGAALHHIHHLDIVHLDLKPSNILVDDDGDAKIMDFGVAIEGRQVLDRKIRGTLQYMAPEVLSQDRVDSRADLYSLGMTLYETVTGTLPAYGRSTVDIIRMHLDESIRRVAAINPSIPPPLEEVIMRLLAKDPSHRFSSAAAMVETVAQMAGVAVPGDLLIARGELYAAPLIGRKQEHDRLLELVAEAREGRGTGVIVAGAEGMGKSRIVRDVTLRAQLD
jgi:eukaryotic-like serine/threonine-protein kinase